MKRISADGHRTKVLNPRVEVYTDHELLSGKYVAYLYDRKCYVECVLEYSEEQKHVKVDFMKRSETSRLFSRPSESLLVGALNHSVGKW